MYNNKRGVLEFREAIQSYLAKRGWTIDVSQIDGTAGVVGGIVGALLTNCQPGDTVLLPEPFFIGHRILLETLGFKIRYWSVPWDKAPNWDDLQEQMKTVQAVILTSPANPTGFFIPPSIRVDLAQSAAENHCLLILDEVYRDFIWSEMTPDDSPYEKLNLQSTIVIRSFSKTLAIPGWRVGYIVTNPDRVEKFAIKHDSLYLGASTIAQFALADALTNKFEQINEYISLLRQQLIKSQSILAKAFADFGMDPLPVPASYYMLLRHHRASDLAATKELLERKIAVVPASVFCVDQKTNAGLIRLHFAVTPEKALQVENNLKKDYHLRQSAKVRRGVARRF